MNITSKQEKIGIWLDCDPGVDDLFAILVCAFAEDMDLIGISASTGNTNVENSSKNILRILNRINRLDIPIVKGSSNPLCEYKYEFAEVFHGKDGLEVEWELPLELIHLIKSGNYPKLIYK